MKLEETDYFVLRRHEQKKIKIEEERKNEREKKLTLTVVFTLRIKQLYIIYVIYNICDI